MTTFIQLHLLTAYPAANLNRDDTGAPKTVVLGGATRLRVSSQSLKRAWRTSALFEQALAGHIGIRSGRIAREAATILIEKGIEEKKAIEWAAKIADYLGKAKNDKKPKDPPSACRRKARAKRGRSRVVTQRPYGGRYCHVWSYAGE